MPASAAPVWIVPPGRPAWLFADTACSEPSNDTRTAQASRKPYSRSSAVALPQGDRPSTLTVPAPSRSESCHSSRPVARASAAAPAPIENATKAAASLTPADYTCDVGPRPGPGHLTGRGGLAVLVVAHPRAPREPHGAGDGDRRLGGEHAALRTSRHRRVGGPRSGRADRDRGPDHP